MNPSRTGHYYNAGLLPADAGIQRIKNLISSGAKDIHKNIQKSRRAWDRTRFLVAIRQPRRRIFVTHLGPIFPLLGQGLVFRF